MRHRNTMVTEKFQSTLPGWGATWPLPSGCVFQPVFQSTLPGWGATTPAGCRRASTRYFNPRSPDGERRRQPRRQPRPLGISIHAPRMGSDIVRHLIKEPNRKISIHAPRMGSDSTSGSSHAFFQISIHAPRMGSDHTDMTARHIATTISIHAPRMGSDRRPAYRMSAQHVISIHAPRMGSDSATSPATPAMRIFQSTLPGWGAT